MTSRQALPRDDTMKTAIQILAFCLALMSPGPGRADAVDPSVDTLAFDSMNAVRGLLLYDAGSSKEPATGESTLTLTAKNQSGKSASAKVTVCVTDSDE